MPDYQTHCPVLHRILTQKMEAREVARKPQQGYELRALY